MSKGKMHSKRHMLLIEVLISLSLVLLCLLPLLQPHIVMIQAENEFIHEVQLDRVVNKLFADLLVGEFYSQRMTWQVIAENRAMIISPDKLQGLDYSGTYTISHVAPSRGVLDESKPFHLVNIKYTFIPRVKKGKAKELTYNFQLFVQREKQQQPEGTEAQSTSPLSSQSQEKIGA